MYKIVSVRALPGYRLYACFSDGAEGEVDLSDDVDRGALQALRDPELFEKVQLEPGGGVKWTDEIDACPDWLYMRLTGKTPEELFPQLDPEKIHA